MARIALAPVAEVEDAPKSLSDQAYEQLLGMMLAGELPAGSVLQERRLANALNISRTPIREALGKLECEGLVARSSHRLLTVRQLSVEEFVDVFNVRKLLEVEAADLAASRIDPGQARRVRDALHDLLAEDHPTSARRRAVDELVHGTVCEASGNHLLARMTRDLRRRTHIFDLHRIGGRFRQSCEEHLEIIDAVVAGDAPRARRAVAAHIDNVRRGIVEKLLRSR